MYCISIMRLKCEIELWNFDNVTILKTARHTFDVGVIQSFIILKEVHKNILFLIKTIINNMCRAEINNRCRQHSVCYLEPVAVNNHIWHTHAFCCKDTMKFCVQCARIVASLYILNFQNVDIKFIHHGCEQIFAYYTNLSTDNYSETRLGLLVNAEEGWFGPWTDRPSCLSNKSS